MNWPPDLSRWLLALGKARIGAPAAVGCWALFGLAELDLLYLGGLPTEFRVGIAVGGVFATPFAVVPLLGRTWDLISGYWRKRRREAAARAELDKLSASEEALLRHQAKKNEQTFSISFASPVAAGLRRKGLLELSSTVGGLQGGHAHTIPDFLWAEIRRRWKVAEQPEKQSDGPF